jgi:hypothetical protein
MTGEFVATFVYAGEDDETLTAGLADHPFKVTQYLTLQRSRSPGDAELYVELSDQIRACHEGIERVTLYGDRCVLQVTERAARKLRTGATIVIELGASASHGLEGLSSMLRRMLNERFEDRRGSGSL